MIDLLNDVPAFVTVVETGGFAAAARRLNLSRSATGKAIARLEDRLGVRLFHRTTRRLGLTDDGQAFYERCQRAVDELQAGRAILESGRKQVSGKLRVSMPVLLGRRCIAPILTRLAATHPGLDLDLNFSDRPVDLIEDGFDLAIRSGALGDSTGLVARRIAYQRMTVCASPTYIQAHGRPETPSDLGQHAAILYCRGGRVRSWLFPRVGTSPEQFTPQARLRLDDLEAIVDAAVAGFGIAWLQCWLVRDRVRSGDLIQLLADVPAHGFDSHVVWTHNPHLPMRVRVAIDALAAETPDLGML